MRGQQEEIVMDPDSSEEEGGSHDADVQRQRDWMEPRFQPQDVTLQSHGLAWCADQNNTPNSEAAWFSLLLMRAHLPSAMARVNPTVKENSEI